MVASQAILGSLPLLVARHTPAHRQRRGLNRSVHTIYLAVADLAVHPCQDMPLVCEVNVVGKIVNPDPGDRFPLRPIFHELQDLGLLGRDGPMTPNASLHRGNTGDGATSRIGVAILTRDLVLSSVKLVTEHEGLRARFRGLRRRLLRRRIPLVDASHGRYEKRDERG